ncbi:UNVERIFIED_CONTAM: hypothetical protein K2H54_015197 [Gekko kuhli]
MWLQGEDGWKQRRRSQQKSHGGGGDNGKGSGKMASPDGDWLEGAGDIMPKRTVGAIRTQDLAIAVACRQTCSLNQKELLQDQLEPRQQEKAAPDYCRWKKDSARKNNNIRSLEKGYLTHSHFMNCCLLDTHLIAALLVTVM